jgi:hypothetical protein
LKELVRPEEDLLALDQKFQAIADPEARAKYLELKRLCQQAKVRQWKPGAPAVLFQKQFHGWPAKNWVKAAKGAVEAEGKR